MALLRWLEVRFSEEALVGARHRAVHGGAHSDIRQQGSCAGHPN
ncbi:MAG: hypothetical protein P4M05_28735 [Bradyrhizobium sp.]|nr:hypothetical protein [Bradyrhizobium sp.]